VNAPKKPMTAYFLWMKKNRRKVVQSMPIGYSMKQLSGKMSKMWAALPKKEKAKYTEKSKKEMKVYEKLVTAYKHTSNYKMFQKKKQEYTISKTGKFRKDPNRPKAPNTAYFLFMADKREETKKTFPELNHKQLISKLAELWNNLSREVKQRYMNKAEENKRQWQIDIKAYEKTDEFKKYMEEKRKFLESKKATNSKGGITSARETKVAKKEKGSQKSKKRVTKEKHSKKLSKSPRAAKAVEIVSNAPAIKIEKKVRVSNKPKKRLPKKKQSKKETSSKTQKKSLRAKKAKKAPKAKKPRKSTKKKAN